jgi:vacuolar-type H+-ATPase subunit D/Vma8
MSQLNNIYGSLDEKNTKLMKDYTNVVNNYNSLRNNAHFLMENNMYNNKNVTSKVHQNEKQLQMQRQDDIKNQIDHESNIISICGIILVFICIMLVLIYKSG